MQPHALLPVVHHLDHDTSVAQGTLALSVGADGVFLISHGGQDAALLPPAAELKARFPHKMIGLNLLRSAPPVALEQARTAGLDMVWVDAPGVTSSRTTAAAAKIGRALLSAQTYPQFFGSVAFKYQPAEPDPGRAARQARQLGMIPTTSGPATGAPPSLTKIVAIRRALGGKAPLAVASGMTPENVAPYLPYVSHFLVATGVSSDAHHFDAQRLESFLHAIHG